MADEDWGPLEPQLEGEDTPRPGSRSKQGQIVLQPGQPLQFTDVVDVDTPNVRAASIRRTIGETLTAYREAARTLLEGKYAAQRDLAPPHMQGPCSIFVLRCHDGIFVRYDLISQGDAKTRCAELDTTLSEVAPQFSEGVIHFPKDPNTYVPSSGGPEISLHITDAAGGLRKLTGFALQFMRQHNFLMASRRPRHPRVRLASWLSRMTSGFRCMG
jgi:hypothetical protein